MEIVSTVTTETQGRNRIHPKKFALWVACASIMMMFAAFSSAYLVRKAGGNWLEFELPSMFFVSTAVIVLSSVVLHLAYIQYKKLNTSLYRGLLGVGLVLGIGFLALQYAGWEQLKAQDILLGTNPSSSFVYVISGMHALHILGGIIAITLAFVFAMIKKHEVTPRRKLGLEMMLSYWHFVDFLWLYLLGFFLLQQ